MYKLLYFLFQKPFQKVGALLLFNMMKCYFLKMVCLPVSLGFCGAFNFLGNFVFWLFWASRVPESGKWRVGKDSSLSCSLHCQLKSVAHISLLLDLSVTVTAGRCLPIWTGGNNCIVVASHSSTSRDWHLGLPGKGRTWYSNPPLSFKATWGVPWQETTGLSLWAIVHADGWEMSPLLLMGESKQIWNPWWHYLCSEVHQGYITFHLASARISVSFNMQYEMWSHKYFSLLAFSLT